LNNIVNKILYDSILNITSLGVILFVKR